MSDFRTYNVIGGTDGMYVTLFDTTSDADYISNDINITTGVDGGQLVLQDASNGTSYSVTLDASTVMNSRSISGTRILTSSFSPVVTQLPDTLYSTYYIISAAKISSPATIVELPAAKNAVFYGISDVKIKRSIISSMWKTVYSGRSPHYDNSLKIKSWFDNMKIANDLGYTGEAFRLLKALKKIIV